MTSQDPRDTNYMFFMKEGKICIFASKQCCCHSRNKFIATPGRALNHSAKRFNLKAKAVELDGTTSILLQATRAIDKDDELLFDFGVRKGKDGEK
ncbi:hypothetical protein DPMN_045214 [Dreissena polymorpha]|uniref:SET domain-containing protein n=1 Tax=Dreissena polymorpha TaxID=45954 RepID=A0A9D4D631_DREPO|nr:hypothetical protein DPMN_045214 [Dreissena polymorpha]